jgi:ATP-dependent RNA helicase DDX23/PRP28
MIDLGFAPQMEQILENMGGALKSDQDVEEEKNAIATDEDILKYRITAMFSATMPPEVERLAKKILTKCCHCQYWWSR